MGRRKAVEAHRCVHSAGQCERNRHTMFTECEGCRMCKQPKQRQNRGKRARQAARASIRWNEWGRACESTRLVRARAHKSGVKIATSKAGHAEAHAFFKESKTGEKESERAKRQGG
eukprot:6201598-Pleurochrysis_carterae.AAC.9